MLAIDKTTNLFITSVKEAIPNVYLYTDKSVAWHGRSNYVYIDLGGWRPVKVRISDHPVGMNRALRGDEELFVHHLAKPASWAVWVSQLPKRRKSRAGQDARQEGK